MFLKVTDSYSPRLHVTCFSSLLFSSSPSTKWHISSSHLILSSSSSRPPLVFHPHPSGIHRIFHFLHLSALLSSFQRRHKWSLHEKTAVLFLSMFIFVAVFGSQVPPRSLTSGSYLTLSRRNHIKLKAFLACRGACYQTLLPFKPKIWTFQQLPCKVVLFWAKKKLKFSFSSFAAHQQCRLHCSSGDWWDYSSGTVAPIWGTCGPEWNDIY